MTRPSDRIGELTEQGAVERQELVSAVRLSAQEARSAARRVGAFVKTAGTGVALAGVGLAVVSVFRRIRARRRPRFAWKRMRRSLEDVRASLEKHKPRPLPLTLLLALARSKTARRAIAAAVQRAAPNRPAAGENGEQETSDGPLLASQLPEAEPDPDQDSAAREPQAGPKTPPPPVPKHVAKAAPIPRCTAAPRRSPSS